MKELDNTNMCSLLRKKLFEEDGPYHKIWLALQEDNELTAEIRNRQLHICRDGKKVLILAGKSAPKALCDDDLKFFDEKKHEWVAERGLFTVYVAASAADIKRNVKLNY